MFLRKGVTKICSKSTGEQPYRIAISLAWVFSCKFAAYFCNTFSQEHLWVAAFEHSEIFHKIDLFTNHKHLTSVKLEVAQFLIVLVSALPLHGAKNQFSNLTRTIVVDMF